MTETVSMEKEKEFVEFVTKALVKHPEEVTVGFREDPEAYTIEINVSQEDCGKIIGKKGKVISSIKTLVSLISSDREKKWILDVPDKKDQASES